MKARQIRSGKTVDDFDLSIAAIAAHNNLKLATLNHQHFKRIDTLDWEDWSMA
jgi:predicted nucleic acid-binding protein